MTSKEMCCPGPTISPSGRALEGFRIFSPRLSADFLPSCMFQPLMWLSMGAAQGTQIF